jgi:hypothetical protein
MAKRTGAERQAAWEARQREREARWRGHVQAWQGSGDSQAAYCRQHGLTPAEFSWWKHELARRDGQRRTTKAGDARSTARTPAAWAGRERVGAVAQAPFVPLQLTAARTGSVCDVELRNGRRLRLADGADPRWVAALAAALEETHSC